MPNSSHPRRSGGLAAAVLLATSAPALAAPEPNGCPAAIQVAEGAARLPPGLLGSIAMVESGRPDPRTRRPAPWPWTINVAGAGSFYSTKAEAIAAVEAARATGARSIDVGCMQVNLAYHPGAFATLDQAFDPAANAGYAAGFLTRLFSQTGSWPEAAASYHSQTPGLREGYRSRVLLGWAGSARYGGTAVAARGPAADPLRNYTPAFRAQLAENASNHAGWVAMGIVRPAARTSRVAAAPRTGVRLASLAHALPHLN